MTAAQVHRASLFDAARIRTLRRRVGLVMVTPVIVYNMLEAMAAIAAGLVTLESCVEVRPNHSWLGSQR